MSYPRQVSTDVFALGRWWGVLVYLIVGPETVLVDTGPAGHASKILNAVRAVGLDPSRIDRIVLTHFDYDHSGSAAQLSAELQAPIAIHAADALFLENPHMCPGIRRMLYHPPMSRILGWHGIPANVLLADGDTLGEWMVVHTPGHTPGSISLIRESVGIVGDALLFKNGRLRPNVWHLSTDQAQQLASAKRLARAGLRTILPGHYAPCTNPQATEQLRHRFGR